MNEIVRNALIIHVFAGVFGMISYYTVCMGFLKKMPHFRFLAWESAFGLASFIISWIFGGYYYIFYYGGIVKPFILGDERSFAHTIFMEAKEHIFLFIPILSAVVLLMILLGKEEIAKNKDMRYGVASIAGLIVFLSVVLALSGMLISGAAR